MKKNLWFLLLVCCLFFISPFSSAQAQASSATVGFSPSSTPLKAGSEGEIAVVIKNAEGLYAFDISLHYDPAAVEIVDADPGQAGVQVSQGTFLDAGMVVRNQVDAGTGTISFVMTQLNPSEEKNGDGTLLVLRVRGVKLGTSNLTFEKVQLSNRDGITIEAAASAGEIVVSQQGPGGPTSTPLPVVTAQINLTPGVNATTGVATPSATLTLGSQSTQTQVSTGMGSPSLIPTGVPQSTLSAAAGSTIGSGPWNISWFWIVLTFLEIILLVWVVIKLRSRKKKKNGTTLP